MLSLPSHRTLISIACILWIVSFGAEVTHCQPYSTPGIYVSPILMVLGLIQFMRYRRGREASRRAAWQQWRANPASVEKPDVRDPNVLIWILLGFWTGCVIIWMGFVFLGSGAFRRSDAFAAAKMYSFKDSAVLAKTGGIRSVGFMVGGKMQLGTDPAIAELSFTVVGKEHNVPVNVTLERIGATWRLEKLESSKPVN